MGNLHSFDPLDHETPKADKEVLAKLSSSAACGNGDSRAIEIGTWVGSTAVVLAQHFRNVLCIDHFRGNTDDRLGVIADRVGNHHVFETFCKNMDYRLMTTVFPLIGDSLYFAEVLPSTVTANLIFIDALHTYGAVVADIEAWEPRVRPYGILCGHDYQMGSVKQAVNDTLRGKEIHNEANVWWVTK